MKVYELTQKVVREIRKADNPHNALAGFLALKTYMFRRQDLLAYGLAADDIDEMLERGTLREVEVGRSEAIGIKNHHRFHADVEYRTNLLMDLKKAREYRSRQVAERRELLLNEVIIPRFGKKDVKGNEIPPESVVIMDVVRALEGHPDIASMYSARAYHGVWRDIHGLGIGVADKRETSRKIWEKRLKDPKVLEECRRSMIHATKKLRELYERDPERAKTHYMSMTEVRRRKMRDDPDFRSAMLKHLSRCSRVFWEKYAADEKFGQNFREKRLEGLAKGREIIGKRTGKRRKALLHLIETRFGGLDNVSAGKIVTYLENEMHEFGKKYYSEFSMYYLIRNDLHYLRTHTD